MNSEKERQFNDIAVAN